MVLMESDNKMLKHGITAPDFNLKGIDGKFHSRDGYRGKKALLVIFMCNHCPYVKAKVDIINQLARHYSAKGLAVVGINSNNAEDYPDDSFGNMVKWAEEKEFAFDYLVDETQEVGMKYGAVCTPDPFLFDSDFNLAYHGRIDDGHYPQLIAKSTELKDAIVQLLSGKAVNVEEHPSIGCSIKWKHSGN